MTLRRSPSSRSAVLAGGGRIPPRTGAARALASRLTLGCLTLVVAFGSLAEGQTQGRLYRLGVLAQTESSFGIVRAVVLPELAKAGFSEGVNLAVSYRAGGAQPLPELARSLAAETPDAVLAIPAPAAQAFVRAAPEIGVVFFGGEDAITEGLAESLSRPGRNTTGVVILTTTLDTKRFQLLHEAVPRARRIAVLLHARGPLRGESERQVRAAAASAGVEVLVLQAEGPDEFPAIFEAMEAAGAEALLIGANAGFFGHSKELIRLAADARLPTACEWAIMAEQGCVLGYGPHRVNHWHVVAGKLVQVLRGASAGGIPVEQPAFFEFVINLRAARAIGLDLSPDFLARADRVIE